MKSRSRGLLLSYGYFILNTIIGVFMSAFIVRTVGKTDHGVYQSVTAFIAYLTLLEFGTGTIMARNISLCKKDGTDDGDINKSISTIWLLTIFLAVLIILVSFGFWHSMDKIYANSMTVSQIALGKRLFVFAVCNLIFGFITSTLNGLLLGYECYTIGKILSIIKLLLRTTLVIIALSIKADILLVALIDFLMALSVMVITLLFCIFKLKAKLVFRYFDKQVFKTITPLALAMLLQTLVNTANGSVDKFCISIMLSPEDVSIYAISMTIFSMFSSIATIPITMFMPQIAKNIKSGVSGRELTGTLIQPCRLNVLITGVVAFGFACVGQQFFEIIYDVEYRESWIYAIIIILPMFINMTNGVIVNVLDVLNKRHVRSYILMITTFLNIVFTIFGIKYIGMIGAAIATAISLTGQVILLNIYYKKKIGIDVGYLFVESYRGLLLPLVVACAIAWIVKGLFRNVLLQFFIAGMAFVIIFSVLYILFGLNECEKNKLRSIMHKQA